MNDITPSDQLHNPSPRPWLRRSLMLAGVGAVVLGLGWSYVTSGRYVSTDNAYVKANKILLAPDVTGPVMSVNVVENQYVEQGQALFQIETLPYEILYDKAKADVAAAAITVAKMKALYRKNLAERERAQAIADFAEREMDRQSSLIKRGSVSESQLDGVALTLSKARHKVLMLDQAIAESLSALSNDPDIPVALHPLYQAALAEERKAHVSLERTQVTAPSDGYVGSPPAVGNYARASLPMLNFVSKSPVWIEANFKETELTAVKVGQPVRITIDTYPDQAWTGTVESISPATASEFSLLPAQNSSGNWVKVVQRIATRIKVESGPKDLTLRPGMSAEVEIDTGRYPNRIVW